MNQVKTGRFIAERRKALGYTQLQLAEIIGVSDRTVSKWERGAGMPDVSLMLPLCNALKISVNDLLCGEKIAENNIVQKTDENVIGIVKTYRKRNKALFVVMFTVFYIVSLLVSVILSDRFVTKQFMDAGTELSIGFENEIRALQESKQGMTILKENIPLYEDCISERFELLELPLCVMLINKDGTVVAKTDTDENSGDYRECYEQALDENFGRPGYLSMYSSGKNISYAKSFEYQGEIYVLSAYSSHNQLGAALQSEFFLFSLLVISACFAGILLLYILIDKLWLSAVV